MSLNSFDQMNKICSGKLNACTFTGYGERFSIINYVYAVCNDERNNIKTCVVLRFIIVI